MAGGDAVTVTAQDWTTWLSYALAAAVVVGILLVLVMSRKNRPFMPGDVFRASRWTRGHHLFPTQVGITPTSVVQHRPRWLGKREESIHIAHVASVKVETHLVFADVVIETSGGSEPIRCHGHHKADAARMKTLIEQHQTAQYRARATAAPDAGGGTRACPFCAETIKACAAPARATCHPGLRRLVRRPVTVHVLAVGWVVLLLVALALPLTDSREAATYRRQHHALSLGMLRTLRARVRDVTLNVILFIPLGALGRRSLRHAGVAPLPALLVIVGGSMALSLGMETLQHVIPGRYPSLVDVLANSGGATIGVTGDMAVQGWRRFRSLSSGWPDTTAR